MGEHDFEHWTQEEKVGGSLWAHVQPGLHSKLQVSQEYIVRPYLKKYLMDGWVDWGREGERERWDRQTDKIYV